MPTYLGRGRGGARRHPWRAARSSDYTCAGAAGSDAASRGAAGAGKGGAAAEKEGLPPANRDRGRGGPPGSGEEARPRSVARPRRGPRSGLAAGGSLWGEVCPLPKRRHFLRVSERVLELHHLFGGKLTWSRVHPTW